MSGITVHYGCQTKKVTSDDIRQAFCRFRAQLQAAGISLAASDQEVAQRYGAAAPAQSCSNEALGGAPKGAVGGAPEGAVGVPPPPAQPSGWLLVAQLGWTLRSDGTLTAAQVGKTLEGLGPANAAALWGWLEQWADVLGTNAYLATKNRGLRLQFAALGQEWAEALLASPELADYLESEAQAVNLEEFAQLVAVNLEGSAH